MRIITSVSQIILTIIQYNSYVDGKLSKCAQNHLNAKEEIRRVVLEEWENSLLGSCFLKYHFWWKSGINSERKWDYLGNVMWRYCNDFWRKMGGVPAQQSWSVVTGQIINRLKCTCLLPFRVLIFFVNEKERNSEGLQRFVSDTCRYCSKRSWVSYCWLTLLIVFTI